MGMRPGFSWLKEEAGGIVGREDFVEREGWMRWIQARVRETAAIIFRDLWWYKSLE